MTFVELERGTVDYSLPSFLARSLCRWLQRWLFIRRMRRQARPLLAEGKQVFFEFFPENERNLHARASLCVCNPDAVRIGKTGSAVLHRWYPEKLLQTDSAQIILKRKAGA